MKPFYFFIPLSFFITINFSFAQKITSDSIRLNPEGDMTMILKTQTKKNLLYNRTIKWINATYQNPEKVIVGQQQNESVNVQGYKSNTILWKSAGVSGSLGMSYHIYFTLQDTSLIFRFKVDEIRNEAFAASAQNNTYVSNFFKKDGTIRPFYSDWKIQLEQKINELFFSYIEKLNDNAMSSDEALAELKKAKDKLDRGIITQQEYDKMKEELMPFIK
jgi:hypothetical protein